MTFFERRVAEQIRRDLAGLWPDLRTESIDDIHSGLDDHPMVRLHVKRNVLIDVFNDARQWFVVGTEISESGPRDIGGGAARLGLPCTASTAQVARKAFEVGRALLAEIDAPPRPLTPADVRSSETIASFINQTTDRLPTSVEPITDGLLIVVRITETLSALTMPDDGDWRLSFMHSEDGLIWSVPLDGQPSDVERSMMILAAAATFYLRYVTTEAPGSPDEVLESVESLFPTIVTEAGVGGALQYFIADEATLLDDITLKAAALGHEGRAAEQLLRSTTRSFSRAFLTAEGGELISPEQRSRLLEFALSDAS